ncbi:MAG: 26S proteasome non-ATPase regulatory subunit 3 [Marteilia pararefringens]
MGKINALSGSYSDSLKHFTEASRKCPTGYAFDFHSIVTKNLLIVTLLLGNMPEKSLLSGKHMEAYRRLAASVVQGKLQEFHKVVASNRHLYEKDQMLGLILRLPNNVLKMALKLICKSYSHISLEDVAKRLELSDLSDVHYILQNAIMNNVIQATIENQSVLVSKPQPDLYCSAKPSKLFQDRTEFCQKLLEKSKKAIRHIQDLKAYDEEDYIDLSDTQFDFDLFNNNYSDMTDEF